MSAKSTNKFHLFLDFDGTILKNNTIPFLNHLRQDSEAVTYDTFLESYMTDYERYVQQYLPRKGDRTTLQQEYEYLAGLHSVEKSSIVRIDGSGWLRGLQWSPQDLSVFDHVARQLRADKVLEWRSGFVELIQAVWRHRGFVDILSVNWSRQFIQSLIRHEYGDQIDTGRIQIYSNEIDPLGSGRLSRVRRVEEDDVELFWPEFGSTAYQQSSGIWTSNDKANIMNNVSTKSRADNATMVYVGDSKTDLRCIVEADLGICIREDENRSEEQHALAEVLDRLHIHQQPVGRRSAGNKNSANAIGPVWYAKDFKAIHKSLFVDIEHESSEKHNPIEWKQDVRH